MIGCSLYRIAGWTYFSVHQSSARGGNAPLFAGNGRINDKLVFLLLGRWNSKCPPPGPLRGCAVRGLPAHSAMAQFDIYVD